MKTKVLLTLIAIVLMLSTSAQKSVIELTFTASYNDQFVPLDSILVENLTKGGDTVLYYPDTVLFLDINTGTSPSFTLSEDEFLLTQNSPNPFNGKTSVGIYLPDEDNIHLTLIEPGGRHLTNYCNNLLPGFHGFTVYSDGRKILMLSATVRGVTKTIKLVSVNGYDGQESRIEYNGKVGITGQYKSKIEAAGFIFELGDTLRYTGFAGTPDTVNGSDVIEDSPLFNQFYHFEITEGIPCPGVPFVSYEGQTYLTVMIGVQCWLKENLNVGTMINSTMTPTNNAIIEKYCNNNNPDSCAKYGGLYRWDEMMQYTSTPAARGICPQGWHLPTDNDWKVLEGTVDSHYGVGDPEWDKVGKRGFDAGKNLKTASGWPQGGNGTNLYGFSGLPGGNCYLSFYNVGLIGYWWTSSQNLSDKAYARFLDSYERIDRIVAYKIVAYSVRCLKDE